MGRPRQLLSAILPSFLLISASAFAQEVKPGGKESIRIRGILSGTLYMQDALFATGNGQRAEYVSEESDQWWHGGDVRNTRVGLDFTGPELFDDWRAGVALCDGSAGVCSHVLVGRQWR